MFIGRERELDVLNRLYASSQFEFAVVYGRKRVGKTTLINRFIEDKDAIYFAGVESNAKQNLKNLTACIMEYAGGPVADSTFLSYQAALEYVFGLAKDKRLVLVIDEYPYVGRVSKNLATVLQTLIDKYKDTSHLMLIICGSSMAFMEDRVLSYKAPLYGRRTAQILLEPFTFAEVSRLFPSYSAEDKALAYGIAGGTPQYVLRFDDSRSVADNVRHTFLRQGSFLNEEPANLLKQEVREPAVYTAILSAIAEGATRMSEIAERVGEDTNVCAIYLKVLIGLGIIVKEIPYGEKTSRKPVYVIADNMFRFWYRFVPDNTSLIARGAADLVYSRIEPRFAEYMSAVFVEICKQYLWQQVLLSACPVSFSMIGGWWGSDLADKSQVDIDIVAASSKTTALVGTCLWTDEAVDQDVVEALIRHSQLLSYTHLTYYVFAKTGFSEACRKMAAKNAKIHLVTFADIVGE